MASPAEGLEREGETAAPAAEATEAAEPDRPTEPAKEEADGPGQREPLATAEQQAVEPQLLRMLLLDPCGNISTVEVLETETVGQLKGLLEQVDGIPAHEQRLICRGVLMSEERTLQSYKLKSGDRLRSAAKPRLRSKPSAPSAARRMVPPKAPRGFLMTEVERPWRPGSAGHVSPVEALAFFDSHLLPAAWNIHS